jgi:hypothetical protein
LQIQSDGNTDGQTNNNGLPQNQISETPAEIQPMDMTIPSGKNYIKVLQLSGNRSPNDLGYAGTWEYFDPTPVGTERMRYDDQKPQDVDEVGEWTFFDPTPINTERTVYGTANPNTLGEIGTWTFFDPVSTGTEKSRYDIKNPADVDEVGAWSFFDPTPINTERIFYGAANPNTLGEIGTWTFVDTDKIRQLTIGKSGTDVIISSTTNESIKISWQRNVVRIMGRANITTIPVPPNGVLFVGILSNLPYSAHRFEGGALSAHPVGSDILITVPYRISYDYLEISLEVPIRYPNFDVTYTSRDNAYTSAQADASNTWQKTGLGVPIDNRENIWRKTGLAGAAVANRTNTWRKTETAKSAVAGRVNIWRKTKLATDAASDRVNNWGRTQ